MMNKIISLLSIVILMSSCGIHKTIYVAASSADCESKSSKRCLKIKEAQEDDWIILPNDIEGFDYKEGTAYKIVVKAVKIKDPADTPSLKYKFVKIISEEKRNTPQEMFNFNGNWRVSKLIGMKSLSKAPSIIIDINTKKISGNAGCNSYGVGFSIEGNQLKFETPIATKMMCTNMPVEKTFFDCLQKTTSYKISNGELAFYTEGGEELLTCRLLTSTK